MPKSALKNIFLKVYDRSTLSPRKYNTYFVISRYLSSSPFRSWRDSTVIFLYHEAKRHNFAKISYLFSSLFHENLHFY